MKLPFRSFGVAQILLVGGVLGLAAHPARGEYTIQRVLDGLNQPIYMTQAPGDPNSLYVVERTDGGNQVGRIRQYDLTTHSLTTFLDLGGVWNGDGGVFAMGFHPDFQTNGLFYVTSAPGSSPANTSNMLDEYQVVEGTPQFVRRILEYPALNNVFHNVNQPLFRPGGNNNEMFVTTGDGGTQASEGGFNPALIENPDSIYGKVLRIDLTADFSTPANSATHAGVDVVAMGIRNPYRGSFDRSTGDFYFGDVGFNVAEEFDFIPAAHITNPAATPLDFGWTSREGTVATDPAPPGGAGSIGDIEPILDYPHPGRSVAHPAPFSGNASVGGYVYRGPVPELQGRYFFADFVNGNVYSALFDTETDPDDYDGTNLTDLRNHTVEFENLVGEGTNIEWISSFAEDLDGNLYILKFGNSFTPANGLGEIFRIVPSLDLKLTVNRDTGEMDFVNDTGEVSDILGYSLASAAGGLNTNVFTPIAGRLDNSDTGDGSIDPVNEWQVTSTPGDTTSFAEESTGTAASLGIGAQFQLGPTGGWFPSIFEDLELSVMVDGGGIVQAVVQYVGNGGQPFDRSDLDADGDVDIDDWTLFLAGNRTDLGGMTAVEAYLAGDLNNDGANDYFDFLLFRDDFIAQQGAAAFDRLGTVPEPAGAVLMGSILAMLVGVRSRRRLGPRD